MSGPEGGGGVPGLGGGSASVPCGIPPPPPPPVNRMTDRCKNITLATTSLQPVKIAESQLIHPAVYLYKHCQPLLHIKQRLYSTQFEQRVGNY